LKTNEQTQSHIAQLIKVEHDQFESAHRRKDGSIWHVEISAACRSPVKR
jgi:hypothetical protein